MKVLVDTSVWVSHFKLPNQSLTSLLIADRVLCHPYVIGELACGTLPVPRERTLSYFKLLAQANIATLEETLYLVEQNKLCGQGCGLIDIGLLASTLLTPEAVLWTADKRLKRLATSLNIQFVI